jgi:hypothetical protein
MELVKNAIKMVYDDGGRENAGYKGTTNDCTVRAISIATETPYQDVYDKINEMAKKERIGKRKRGKSNARTGVYTSTTRKYMSSIGWEWVPCMNIGTGCTTHLRQDELPNGRIIVKLSKHIAAVIDGELHDIYDCSRDGTRCVYGYWHNPS